MTRPLTILLVCCLAVTLIAALFYGVKRSGQIRELRQEAAASDRTAEKIMTGSERAVLEEKFPATPDVASFTERLYRIARNAGLQNVEIVTASETRHRAVKKKSGKPDLAAYPLRISFEGRYRAVAGYVKAVQESGRFTRMTQLELKPGPGAIKASMTVEILSVEAPDAA